MQIALAQINPTIGAIEKNGDKILMALMKAKQQGADLLLLPELAICGYPPEDLLLLSGFLEACQMQLERIIKASDGLAVIIGTVRANPKSGEKSILNSAAIIENGKLLGFQDKTLLAEYDVFSERRYFAPNKKFQLWDIWGAKVAITICEDIWKKEVQEYAIDPIEQLCQGPIDYILNLSASPYYQGRLPIRQQMAAHAASTLKAPMVYCNQVGGNDSLIFDGRSFIINASGELLKLAKGFEEDFFVFDLNQKATPISLPDEPMKALYQALTLGVKDYFVKQGFSKALVGLSGGVDSALTACIACQALGSNQVTAITMPSRYTSSQTLDDAKKLAEGLGIKIHEISIEAPFQAYLNLLNPFFKGLPEDTTEENLQSRIRGMILMAFSNKFGAIVLNSGNKSELAMGYSTLYGDLCGGLGVLSDLSKDTIYKLANWINQQRPIIPQSIIEREPSAELKPNQKDSDSLPPYAIIDAFLEDYVESHLSATEIAKKRGWDLPLIHMLIKKLHHNEYKRRQAPIGLRVTRKAFTIGRRFPIVQGWQV
jgi:NAD+ synthase (glutamine-hydrolysing)